MTEGKIVLYTFEHNGARKTRPAIIVNDWNNEDEKGAVNLQVFTDFQNDELNPVEWRTSVPYSTEGLANSYRFLEDAVDDAVTVPQPPAPPQTEEATTDQQAPQTGDATTTAQSEDNPQTGRTDGDQQQAS